MDRMVGVLMTTPDDFPLDGPLPEPWTPEQIATWNEEHNAIQPGGAIAFEKQMKADRARLAALRAKGARGMTQAEKDEALDLMMRGAR